MKVKRGLCVFLFLALGMIILLTMSVYADVSGGSITTGTPQRMPADTPDRNDAFAGNVTVMNIIGFTDTQAWQGYFGNVSGTIQLSDAADHVMYNWTVASPRGEVYASINDSVIWPKIECFNYTATGAQTDDSATQAGDTSLTGMNITQLNTMYNISNADEDGVNNTFITQGGAAHALFYTNNLRFDPSECQTTKVFDSSGSSVSGHFEEVLMYEPATKVPVFASILDQDQAGFDAETHDFEMLVLENGHGTDTTATPYYFYVELE